MSPVKVFGLNIETPLGTESLLQIKLPLAARFLGESGAGTIPQVFKDCKSVFTHKGRGTRQKGPAVVEAREWTLSLAH